MLIDIIIIAVIAVIFGLCLRNVIQGHKSGCSGCSGNCSGCHQCSAGNTKKH